MTTSNTTDRPGVTSLLVPLFVGALAVLGTLATYHVFVRTISGQWLDTAAMLGTDIEHPRLANLLSRSLAATNMRTLPEEPPTIVRGQNK